MGNKNVEHPDHYTMFPVEVIELTREMPFCLGNVVKYVLRAPYKGGVEDCRKAKWYMENSGPCSFSPSNGWCLAATQYFDYLMGAGGNIHVAQAIFLFRLIIFANVGSLAMRQLFMAIDDLERLLDGDRQPEEAGK